MRFISSLFLTFMFCFNLQAQEEPSQELDQALQSFMLLLEKTQKSLKEISQMEQKAIPEEANSFQLFYKKITNKAKVEKRSDLLIKTQIEYKLLRAKEIPSSSILVLVRNGKVELFGKVYDKKSALEAMDIALHIRGVKEVVSYLIIKERAKILL